MQLDEFDGGWAPLLELEGWPPGTYVAGDGFSGEALDHGPERGWVGLDEDGVRVESGEE